MGNNNRTDMRDDPTTTEDVEGDTDGGGGGGAQTTQEEASQENNWPLVLWFEAQGLVRSPATGEGRVNVRVSRALLASSSPDAPDDTHKVIVEVSIRELLQTGKVKWLPYLYTHINKHTPTCGHIHTNHTTPNKSTMNTLPLVHF